MQDIHVTAYSPMGSPPSVSMFNGYQPKLVMDDPIVNEIAKKYNKNAGQICVKWGLQHGTSVIPKGTSEQHIVGNLDVLDWELSSKDYEVYSTNAPCAWSPSNAFCTGCVGKSVLQPSLSV